MNLLLLRFQIREVLAHDTLNALCILNLYIHIFAIFRKKINLYKFI